MPRKKTRRKKPEGVYEYIVIRVERYEVDLDFSVNSDVYQPQYAFFLDEDDLLFKPSSRLEIYGRIQSPEDRLDQEICIGFFGDDMPSSRNYRTLKDVQVKGEYGVPRYKSYRGREIPIYDPPKGLAVLHKTRGEDVWSLWTRTPTQFVSDMIRLLGQKPELYVTLHGSKFERKRWIRSIGLQTSNPDEE